MATIGLSKPFYSKYTNSGSTVTYTGGGVLGKFTQLQIELSDDESNILYADNAPAESDNQFTGGTVTITTDDLRPAAMADALGLVSEAISATGMTTTDPTWLVNNDQQVVPYLGIGGIAMKKVDGVIKYVAIVLDKVQFRNPSESISTKGETIEWQTPSLTGDIFRSDKADHDWKRVSSLLDTEADAEAAIRSYLNISAA